MDFSKSSDGGGLLIGSLHGYSGRDLIRGNNSLIVLAVYVLVMSPPPPHKGLELGMSGMHTRQHAHPGGVLGPLL